MGTNMDEDTIDFEEPKKEELQEKDFIQESYKKSPFTFWIYLAVTFAVLVFFWGAGSWYYKTLENKVEGSPFLQVTNRDLSVFLWQFTDKMPQHVKSKIGYLPGFDYQDRIGLKIQDADDFVLAPPELLFLYHTWDRLIRNEFAQRKIGRNEFIEFLDFQPEWQPEYWSKAPLGYKRLVQDLPFSNEKNLEGVSLDVLPLIVRQAFQGWKNYRYEGDFINIVKVKYAVLKQFLEKFPHYARNYWRNIASDSYPKYLETFTKGKYNLDEEVPENEMAPFLKVALFNYIQSQKGL